eukprot:gene9575-11341_t
MAEPSKREQGIIEAESLRHGGKTTFYQLGSGGWYAGGRVVWPINVTCTPYNAEIWAPAPPKRPLRTQAEAPQFIIQSALALQDDLEVILKDGNPLPDPEPLPPLRSFPGTKCLGALDTESSDARELERSDVSPTKSECKGRAFRHQPRFPSFSQSLRQVCWEPASVWDDTAWTKHQERKQLKALEAAPLTNGQLLSPYHGSSSSDEWALGNSTEGREKDKMEE